MNLNKTVGRQEAVRLHPPDCELEGSLLRAAGPRAVVVTHPHPLYGGDMHNPVVKAVANAFWQKGFTALRFNFRGVGASAGRYEGGAGERRDVAAAVEFLRTDGFERIALAGYSFGAWVNALADGREVDPDIQVMVAPPVEMLDFTSVICLPELQLVITGERDPFGPPRKVSELARLWAPHAKVTVIEKADHFFVGCLDSLTSAVLDGFEV